MGDLIDLIDKLCSVERDRMTVAEICIDECLTIMDRHGIDGRAYRAAQGLSANLNDLLIVADGPVVRKERLIRIRAALTTAFPMTDEDLASTPDLHGEGG